MAYKKLSEATLVESVAEEATMLIEENDEIKRASVKDTMEKYGLGAGGGGGSSVVVEFNVEEKTVTLDGKVYTFENATQYEDSSSEEVFYKFITNSELVNDKNIKNATDFIVKVVETNEYGETWNRFFKPYHVTVYNVPGEEWEGEYYPEILNLSMHYNNQYGTKRGLHIYNISE